jgi:hypothetical protein
MLSGATKKLSEHSSIHYTLSSEHTEYMLAAILSNRWRSPKHVGHITHNYTPRVYIHELSTVQYAFSDFFISLHSIHTVPYPVQDIS